MEVSQLANFYPQACSVSLRQNYIYSSLRVEPKESKAPLKKLVLIQIQENKFEGFLGISQRDRKNWSKNTKIEYDYSLCSVVLAKLKGGLSQNFRVDQFIAESRDCERDLFVECSNLDKGVYVAYIEIDWVQDIAHDFTVSMYGNQCVKLQEVRQKFEPKVLDNFLDDIISEHRSNYPFPLPYSIDILSTPGKKRTPRAGKTLLVQ